MAKLKPGDTVTTSAPHGRGEVIGVIGSEYRIRMIDGRLLSFFGESNLRAASPSDPVSPFGSGVLVRNRVAGPRSKVGTVISAEGGKIVVLFPGKPQQSYSSAGLILVQPRVRRPVA